MDRVIERKRSLSQQTLVEDSPDTLKIFSREELVELLWKHRICKLRIAF